MTLASSSRRLRHRHLLGTAALAVLLNMSTANAQNVAQASGNRALANDQAATSGYTLADASNAGVQTSLTGTVDRSTATISANQIVTSARGNDASQNFALDALDGGDSTVSTSLSAGTDGVSSVAGTAIANRQSIGSGFVASDIYTAPIGINTGAATRSQLTVTGNSEDAQARGNNAADAIALDDTSSTGGGGIASYQSSTPASSVAARSRGNMTLASGTIEDSSLGVTGNLARAVSQGNAVDNSLSSTVLALSAPSAQGTASVVPTMGSAPTVNAGFAILSNQSANGLVKAGSGDYATDPAVRVSVDGRAYRSTITASDNGLVAAGYGNSSSNALQITAASIGAAAAGAGPAGPVGPVVALLVSPDVVGQVAHVTNVQSAPKLNLQSFTVGGTAVDVSAGLGDSSITASNNQTRIIGTANLASNTLAVDAGTIGGGTGGSGTGAIGSALVQGDGSTTADAAFSVQNVQDAGTSTISATEIYRGGVAANIAGSLSRSSIALSGNGATAAGTANSAVNAANVNAVSAQTNVAVNNMQSSDASVTASLGSPGLSHAASVIIAGSTSGSDLAVTGNTATGTAIGSNASNSLTLSAVQLAGTGEGGSATAGAIGDNYGATGTAMLASNQKLGQPATANALTPSITSNVQGDTGVAVGGLVYGSALTVDENAQRANALGNAVVNRATVSATTLDPTGSADTALSSSQYGEANVSASSDAHFSLPGTLTQSQASLTGNGNVALAVVNDADNALVANGLGISGTSNVDIASGQFGPPVASGTAVLANQQFATGSTSAAATTQLANPLFGHLVDSSVSIASNVTSSEASANRALNAVTLSSPGGTGNAGLVNTQHSMAVVMATATSDGAYRADGLSPGGVSGSSVAISGTTISTLARGNAVDNQLTLATGSGAAPGNANASLDRFDASASAPAAIVNTQTNLGPVAATTLASYDVPLNGGTVANSSLGITGNTAFATAYGNSANNAVTLSGFGASPGAVIANVQTNNGAVSAAVTGSIVRSTSGTTGSSAVTTSGNQLAATAVGNQVSSAIATPR
jgi:hypothetical protein